MAVRLLKVSGMEFLLLLKVIQKSRVIYLLKMLEMGFQLPVQEQEKFGIMFSKTPDLGSRLMMKRLLQLWKIKLSKIEMEL